MTITTEKMVLNSQRRVSLTMMLQAVGGEFGSIQNRPAILILPGGGYAMCSDREAEVVAFPYLQAGFHAFVLRYSVAEHKSWPNPMEDYEQAMELIRSHVSDWHIIENKIAVIGFSAGGHLAACAATVSRNRPNAAILGYAATGAKLTQLMHNQVPAIVPTEHVDENTCPCFLFAARDDTLVSICNTLDFEQALASHGILFESHIYAYGGHGFSTAGKSLADGTQCSRVPHWVEDSISWLTDVFGQLTPSGMTEPACSGKVNGNSEKMLSADCTMGHLKKQGNAVQELLKDIFTALLQTYPNVSDESSLMYFIIEGMKLREIMSAFHMSPDAIREMDDALRRFPNCR